MRERVCRVCGAPALPPRAKRGLLCAACVAAAWRGRYGAQTAYGQARQQGERQMRATARAWHEAEAARRKAEKGR
jgi:hypothetical protein